MPMIRVLINRVDDPRPVWDDLPDGVALIGRGEEDWTVVGIEEGMASGEPAIGLRIDVEGVPVIAQTSLAAWIAATCALRGAFPASFANTPLGSLI